MNGSRTAEDRWGVFTYQRVLNQSGSDKSPSAPAREGSPQVGASSLRDEKSGIVDSREVSEGPSVSSSGIGSIRGLGSIRSLSLSSISYGSGRRTDSISEHLGCEGAASAAVVRFYPFES